MSKQEKYVLRKQAVVLMIAALLVGILPVFKTLPAQAVEDNIVSNPRIESDGVTTWDCIWFGNYWQEDTNGDGKADKKDQKTPIKWRVLSVQGDDAFLVADKCLDCQKYNITETDVTWEKCTMRSWLNGYGADQNVCRKNYSSKSFMKDAFTPEEREAIRITDVVNNDHPDFQTTGGNSTKDQVFLLSIEEVTEPAYGFAATVDSLVSRGTFATAFAEGQGATRDSYEHAGKSCWWLRSPGFISVFSSQVNIGGGLIEGGGCVVDDDVAVRPALHLNLASVTSDAYAGTVTSEGETGTLPSPTAEIGETPVPRLTYDLKVKTSGDGAVMLQTSETTITTDGNASIDMKVRGREDVLLTFYPMKESAPYTVTVDGKEWLKEGNVFWMSDIQNNHTIVVTFAASATPTPEPVSTPVITLSPELPEPTGSPSSTGEPASASPLPAETAVPSPFETPVLSPTSVPLPSSTHLPEKDLSAIGDGLGVSPETAVKIQEAAKELNVSLDTILVTEQAIQSQKTDEDLKGAYFARLQARASQITERNIKLTWNKVKGADGYEVYGNRCNTKKWIYQYKRKQTIKNGNKKSYIDRKCKKGAYYKYIVRAYKIIDGKKVTIAASKTIHVTTNGGKNGNAKAVKVNKRKVSVKKGKTWRIQANEIKEDKPLRHHREVSYESSRPQAVSVSKKGDLKAMKKGKYTVFAYAQSGIYRKIRVTVK